MSSPIFTVLFVDGRPVGYQFFWLSTNMVHLQPVDNPYQLPSPPQIIASVIDNSWQIRGTSSQDLIDQVLEDLSKLNLTEMVSYHLN